MEKKQLLLASQKKQLIMTESAPTASSSASSPFDDMSNLPHVIPDVQPDHPRASLHIVSEETDDDLDALLQKKTIVVDATTPLTTIECTLERFI
jgi:hypothetical protein